MKVSIQTNINLIKNYVKTNTVIILLFTAFFAGIILGSFIYVSSFENSKNILEQFSLGLSVKSPVGSTLYNCITINIFYFSFIILSGFSLCGAYILYLVPLIKGLTFGYTACFIFSVFGIKGLFVTLLGIIPQTIISGVIVILGCKFSIRFSQKLLKEQKILKSKQFIISELLLFLICSIISLYDVFIADAVIELFI